MRSLSVVCRSFLLSGLCISSGTSCDSFLKDNPDYCTAAVACPDGRVCDLVHHRCGPPDDPGSPAVTQLSPAVGAHDGTTLVTLAGRHFSDKMQVQVGGVAVTTKFNSATELQFVLPAALTCGQVAVTVHDENGQAIPGQQKIRYRYATLAFDPIPKVMAITQIRSVAAGLLDGDSIADLAVTTTTRLTIYHGKGDLSFDTVRDIPIPMGYSDMVLAPLDATNDDSIIGRNTDGVFACKTASREPYVCAVGPINLTPHVAFLLADLNKDGANDILVTNGNMFLNAAFTVAPKFDFDVPRDIYTYPTVMPSGAGTSLAAGDFNQDGNLDIATALPSNGAVVVARGNGAGGFVDPPIVFIISDSSVQLPPTLLATMDANADGKDDLIVLAQEGSLSSLFVARNTGGSFALSEIGPVISGMTNLVLEDLDCDGLKDVVVYGKNNSRLTVYRNFGDGTFNKTPYELTLNLMDTTLAFANLNTADQAIDIAASNTRDSTLKIFRNASR